MATESGATAASPVEMAHVIGRCSVRSRSTTMGNALVTFPTTRNHVTVATVTQVRFVVTVVLFQRCFTV